MRKIPFRLMNLIKIFLEKFYLLLQNIVAEILIDTIITAEHVTIVFESNFFTIMIKADEANISY